LEWNCSGYIICNGKNNLEYIKKKKKKEIIEIKIIPALKQTGGGGLRKSYRWRDDKEYRNKMKKKGLKMYYQRYSKEELINIKNRLLEKLRIINNILRWNKIEEKSTGQQIIELLEKHSGQLFSKSEIRDVLKIEDRRATLHLKKLLQHAEILMERISVRVAQRMFGSNMKRGLRLYYLE